MLNDCPFGRAGCSRRINHVGGGASARKRHLPFVSRERLWQRVYPETLDARRNRMLVVITNKYPGIGVGEHKFRALAWKAWIDWKVDGACHHDP